MDSDAIGRFWRVPNLCLGYEQPGRDKLTVRGACGGSNSWDISAAGSFVIGCLAYARIRKAGAEGNLETLTSRGRLSAD